MIEANTTRSACRVVRVITLCCRVQITRASGAALQVWAGVLEMTVVLTF